MTHLDVRLVEYVAFVVVFGGIALGLAGGFLDDYGWPWRRKAGTNGRWRTDGFVVLTFALIAVMGAVAAAATVFDGWESVRIATTVMLGLIVLSGAAMWASGKAERRSTGGDAATRTEAAAVRTEEAADRAEAASDDTRRSASRTEVAAEAVIRRRDGEGG